jgi:hypothetical protein
MNYGRLVSAALAATVADIVYGFLIYGMLIASEFEKYPNVYRSAADGPAYLPAMFAGIFVAMIAVAAIYAKGYEGGSGLSEGARFGLLFGFFGGVFYGSVNYGVLIINKRLALMLATAGFFEFLIVGTVIGLVYQPDAAAAGRRAAV